MAVFRAWLEAPLQYRFHCFLIQAKTQRPDDFDVPRVAIRVDDNRQKHRTLELRLPSFFRVLRFRLEDRHRIRNAATDLVNAAARTCSAARSEPDTVAGSNATA